MILAGNVALESMGFKTFGFRRGAGGRLGAGRSVYWGSGEDLAGGQAATPGDRDLEKPLAAVQMGLIYVNPEGPNGNPDPLAAARDIRETFARMAMNDEETVALIAAATPSARPTARSASHVAPTRGRRHEDKAWAGGAFRHRQRRDAITSGLEVTWTPPDEVEHSFSKTFWLRVELTKSPAGANQWVAKVAPAQAQSPMPRPIQTSTRPPMLTPTSRCRFTRFTKDRAALLRASGSVSRTRSRGRGSS